MGAVRNPPEVRAAGRPKASAQGPDLDVPFVGGAEVGREASVCRKRRNAQIGAMSARFGRTSGCSMSFNVGSSFTKFGQALLARFRPNLR